MTPHSVRTGGLVVQKIMVMAERKVTGSQPGGPPNSTPQHAHSQAEGSIWGQSHPKERQYLTCPRKGLGEQAGNKRERDTFYVVTDHYGSVTSRLGHQQQPTKRI